VDVARIVALVAGIVIVVLTVWSVFSALVVPRVTSSRFIRGLARMFGGAARRISPRLPTYELRDRLLSYVGPAAMVLLFVIWLCLLLVGFALIIWWDSNVDLASGSWSSRSRSPTCRPSTPSSRRVRPR
jgi:hypothetical protein